MHHTSPLSQIYLDANATTPVLPQAAKAALGAMEDLFGNPSSSHITGLKAKSLMEQTRLRAKQILGSGQGNIIFTSGATEGIQTAILSALTKAKASLDPNKQYSLLYGATEHKAVPNSLAHWNQLLEIGAELKAIPVDDKGALDLDFIAAEVPNALMICTMAVNNETGVYQDLKALDTCIRKHNPEVFWMVDCVQALGKRPLALAQTSIDYAPFSGHKLYAPKGIGFVYIRDGAPFTPFIAGGGQEGGLRSGTENLPGMAALNQVFAMLLAEQDSAFHSLSTLIDYREQLAKALKRAFPTLVFNHSFDNSVPTTLNFAVPGFSSKEIMDLFDAANIRVSSGSACSSKVTRSFVLDAMGLPAWQSESAIRLSFGPAMTQSEVDLACERIQSAANALGNSCLTLSSNEAAADKQPLNGLVQLKSGSSCSWIYADQESKQAVVIDPLPELDQRIDTLLQCQQLEPIAFIDTHGHADHVSGRVALAARYLPQQASDHLGWPVDHQLTEIGARPAQAISLGQYSLVKLATPGHTNDSISLLLCSPQGEVIYAFCGDLVLMGSLGRTNFDSSCAKQMYNSLKLLHSLIGDDTLLCPSHDYNNEFTTSFAAEFRVNPLLNEVINGTISMTQFEQQKARLDTHLKDEAGSEIICGAYTGGCSKAKVKEYDSQSLQLQVGQSPQLKLLDIREPHEYALQHELGALGEQTINVPMTRLVQFVQEHKQESDAEWVLVCRSGSRSLVAAQALHRLGFNKIAHLKGGYALSDS
ncbi:aminotransferase class V-fold PLP-dependent enzyme [Shewanella aegiceratis]|uniref:aminotransferase class V-fold PLP-dependent enzyme n=1 Tax=Shewanella aegiceratis TaxID=2864203 RepID=UPI001C65A0D1|nr:aminotransferase class V-fold PLP-dependent enzyme [Shewanella aegiceratis]QYJ81992.1 aminotransferase class V-fold PLP-dependent enzyme [Shewanella aegiceratis]